jgi:N-acetylglutamate synthase
MSPQDIETIERATLAAVAPDEVLETDGWLAGLDGGTIGRARSAVPLRHDASCDPATLDRLEAAYRERGLEPWFRIADGPGLAQVQAELERRGYSPVQPTLVKTGDAAGLALLNAAPAETIDHPDDAWGAVFLGEGFDPLDGAYRVKALSRSPGAVYAQVRSGERTVAVGVASFGFGWASIHGMRTEKSRRGEGLAGRVLAGLARAAMERGVERVFLQVEEPNAPARALYRRAGLSPAWRYRYWRG